MAAQAHASGILGKSRRHFGDPLIACTSRGMEPTPYADRIYPEVKQCFEQLSSPDSHRVGFDPATTKRQFRVCMTDIAKSLFFRPLSASCSGRQAALPSRRSASLMRAQIDWSQGTSISPSATCQASRPGFISTRFSGRVSFAWRHGVVPGSRYPRLSAPSLARAILWSRPQAPAIRSSTGNSRKKEFTATSCFAFQGFLASRDSSPRRSFLRLCRGDWEKRWPSRKESGCLLRPSGCPHTQSSFTGTLDIMLTKATSG
jgi:hypothetical protein